MTDEKDDVHWITGQELREVYADDLSLDKYDEIRNRASPAPAKILPEKPCDICLLNDLAANDYEKLKAHDAEVAEKAATEARHAAIYEILTDLKFACPGGEPTPICDLCGANRYCIELRSKEQKP